ncbi:MAG: thrombospondin type-1 domain-containing protein [Patescibacteria group bacterium]|nr:thrombospondin type-1 domain-containing protein [Patescibacteria group bacterium]
MNIIFIRNILVVCSVIVGLMSYNLVFANSDQLSCVGGQGYVNGTACDQGSSVWGPCASNRCFDANGDGVDDGDDATINGCTTYGGAKSCGHWVACPKCPPPPPPCTPSWGKWGDCSEECGDGVQTRNNGCGATQSRPCNNECPGECGTLNGNTYDYLVSGWPNGTWCEPMDAVSDPDPVPFPAFDTENNGCSSQKPCEGSVSWDCSTEFGGTENDLCSAVIKPPTVECGDANGVETNSEPVDDLCKSSEGDVNVVPPVTLTDGGNWVWGCRHDVFTQIQTAADACGAPSCIATAVSAISPIMLSDNMNSVVSVACPDLCCTVTNDENNISVTVCDGSTQQIKIEPGQNNLSSVCTLPSEPPVDGPPITVQTMCTSKECNAQGTCQGTPVLADALSDSQCSSTCNSNADCSSGRLIETKP